MKRPRHVAPVIALITLIAAGPSAAQLRPVLVAGGVITGRMLYGPPDERYSPRAYGFSARAGDRLEFTMRSRDFDANLLVVEEGLLYRVLAGDNDGGGETDARLIFIAPEDGRYILSAQNIRGRQGGTYTVSMARSE